MNYYYITGASSGIGEALARQLLGAGENVVFGLSRREAIRHPSYRHHTIDLSDLAAVRRFQFAELAEARRIVLVNNAGTLGEVGRLGALGDEAIVRGFNVNLVAPTILANNFIGAYREAAAEKVIINISSGAARHAVDGWAIYCASKAGLEMLSHVAAREQQMDRPARPFKVLSVAPGIVDTAMQAELREVAPEDFSRREEFVRYKEGGALADPRAVASKLIRLIENAMRESETAVSFR